ncbi:MAG TPA: GNAT family N-acetyltransferase [Anaerolineae bacterium]
MRSPIQDVTSHAAVELGNGITVNLRAIRPDDAPRLQVFFTKLSPQSAFFRFLTSWKELAREKAEYLACVDYQKRMALVATIELGGQHQIIALASYAQLSPPEAGMAEAAVVVQDRYQGIGLGTILLQHLAALARMNNIYTFVGTVHAENTRMLQWLQNSGLVFVCKKTAEGASEIQVEVEIS